LEQFLLDSVDAEECGSCRIDPAIPAQHYFSAVNAVPLLSREEENELVLRWRQFRDRKARERVLLAHLRIPPSVARKAAREYGHEPNKNILTGRALDEAWSGHHALVEELTAEGNLALVESFDRFDPSRGFVFATYAGRSVRNAVHRRLRSLASVVDRPWGKSTPVDIYLDPMRADMVSPEDYCGSRVGVAVTSDNDVRRHGEHLPSLVQRLRPQPEPDYLRHLESYVGCLPKLQAKAIELRMGGLTLDDVADALDVSTATAWRLEQSAIEQMRKEWNATPSKSHAISDAA
jgi:RNA polymerase sigma factor (sigma-70 family)